jgi:hypothetical protein
MGEILNEGQVPVKSTTVSTGRLYTMRKYAILVSLWRHGSRTTTELLLDMADYEISIVGEENAKLAKEYKVLRKAYHPAAHDSFLDALDKIYLIIWWLEEN